MKRLLTWLRAFRSKRQIYATINEHEKEIKRLLRAKAVSERKIEADVAALDRLRKEMDRRLKQASQNAAEARGLNRQLEQQLETSEAVRKGLETQIGVHVAGNELILHRYESLSKIEAYKAAAVAGRPMDDEGGM